MKTIPRLTLLLFCSLASTLPALAEINVRLSVKFILKPDGTRPAPGNVGTAAGFDAEVARGNRILAATGRGFRIQVVEYVDIRPPVPLDQPADYWFNLPARDNRATIENTASVSTAWRWNPNAINIYVNNSQWGQCSFVDGGLSISLGQTIVVGTVLHELGHFFNLRHTHAAADNNGTVGDWGDGDGLDETLPDDPDATAADIDARYPNETPQKRDDLFFNVMSYHQEDRLLTGQMDLWTLNANGARRIFCSGRTWFVAIGGNDNASGADANSPLATFSTALSRVTGPQGNPDDVILLRAGSYTAPPGGSINIACTVSATRGPVVLNRP